MQFRRSGQRDYRRRRVLNEIRFGRSRCGTADRWLGAVRQRFAAGLSISTLRDVPSSWTSNAG